jgi:hypothetical protein
MSDPVPQIEVNPPPPIQIQIVMGSVGSAQLGGNEPNQIQVATEFDEFLDVIEEEIVELKEETDPFPQYVKDDEIQELISEVGVDESAVQLLIDADITALKNESDPFSQYTTETELDASLDDLGNAFTGQMNSHLNAANPHPIYALDTDLTTAIATHESAANPHDQYALDTVLDTEVNAIKGRLTVLESIQPVENVLRPDVEAYRQRIVAAGGTISTAQLNVIDEAMGMIARYGLLSKILHLSPMVGNYTAALQKLYRHSSETSWELSPTGHSSASYAERTGFIGAVGRRLDSGFNPATAGWDATANSATRLALGFFCSVNRVLSTGNGIDMGCVETNLNDRRLLLTTTPGQTVVDNYSVTGGRTLVPYSTTGFLLGGRDGLTGYLLNSGSPLLFNTLGGASGNRPNANIHFQAFNNLVDGNRFESTNIGRLYMITQGLTTAEAITLSRIMGQLGDDLIAVS